MSRIILQPCSNKDAQQHFVDTITNTIPLSLIKGYVGINHLSSLNDIYPTGSCQIWGVTPGGSNLSKWEKISVGDSTLFSASGRIFASGVTTYKLHNKELAARLWGFDPKGQTWEYIYFLDEVKEQHITYHNFNKVVGYDLNYIIQGFNVLDKPKSLKLFTAFDLFSDTYIPPVDNVTFEDATTRLDDLEETDVLIQAKRRVEQARFREHLFGRQTIGQCGICGHNYPISFLVTAHIKKRSQCTPQEKRDPNVVIPMCKFGCDDLFEHGYISVVGGIITSIAKRPTTPRLSEAINALVGKTCPYFTEGRKGYFEWHNSQSTNSI